METSSRRQDCGSWRQAREETRTPMMNSLRWHSPFSRSFSTISRLAQCRCRAISRTSPAQRSRPSPGGWGMVQEVARSCCGTILCEGGSQPTSNFNNPFNNPFEHLKSHRTHDSHTVLTACVPTLHKNSSNLMITLASPMLRGYFTAPT